MSQVLDDLKSTKELLEAHGWCQGKFSNEDGEICLDGAVYIATGCALPNPDSAGIEFTDDREGVSRYSAVWGALLRDAPFEIASRWAWNDDAERTVDDVKQLLDLAIAREEGMTGV